MTSALLFLGLACVAVPSAAPSEALLRSMIAEAALAQAERPDPRWQAAQRDCAGLIRFSYREAFARLAPRHNARGLWRDLDGRAVAFADAETLLQQSFVSLGRRDNRVHELRSGDLLAFRQRVELGAEPVFHLMMVVRSQGVRAGDPLLVYHTGDRRGVRVGRLLELRDDAPLEWQPVTNNPACLGFYRYEGWMP